MVGRYLGRYCAIPEKGKEMKGFRTIAWNVLNAVPVVMAMTESAYQVPDAWMPIWMAVFIVVNLALRTVTTTGIGRSA